MIAITEMLFDLRAAGAVMIVEYERGFEQLPLFFKLLKFGLLHKEVVLRFDFDDPFLARRI